MFTGIDQVEDRMIKGFDVNTIPILPFQQQTSVVPVGASDDANMRDAAKKLEATFLSEMLKSAGFDKYAQGFGSGIGQEQFASFLRDAQAEHMVEGGGIGLAESLYNAMRKVAYE
jgi:Rod binding domain-containing protein